MDLPMQDRKPLRILHCFRSPVGGVFRHVRDLAIEQAKAGHSVGILCDSTTGGEHGDRLFSAITPYLGLGLIRMPINRSVSITDIPVLWRSYKEIRSLRPDIVHGHGAKGGAMARLAGTALRVNRYRVSRLYSPHGGSLHFNPRRPTGWAIFRLERLQEYATDGIVFVCEYERNTYISKVGKVSIRNEVIYNGVGEADFVPINENPDAADFLYVGMLRDLKGPDIFIEALAKTERLVGRPLSGVMVGDGPQKDTYLEMMTVRGLGRRITMRPSMHIREAFALARTLVVPSRAESMPYIVLEALAAGKTLIASDVGGISEVLGKGNPALVPPGDSDALARVMAQSLTTPGWADEHMPDWDQFHRDFSVERMAARITDLYQELAAR
jgi:glycosyltransferase involved in cell wall biosynthesis